MNRSVRLILFILSVCCCSTLILPANVQGQGLVASAEPTPAPKLFLPESVNLSDSDDSQLTIPPAAEIAPQTSVPQYEGAALPSDSLHEAAPFVGDACSPNYWIVSSRCSAQSVHERCTAPWGLDVYQRTPDGRLQQTSLASLQSQIVPGIPVCIFSHGSFVQWDSQCREAHAFYRRIRSRSDAPLQMIFFTWPSDGPYTYLPPIDVAVRGKRADFNGFHMAYLISQIPESCPVSLVGHSHGSRVVMSAMHMAGGGEIDGYVFPYSMGAGRRYRVVLAAAAMDHHWLNPGEHYGCALNRVECLLNLQNRKDLPLSLYALHRPMARRPAARAGFTRRDMGKIGNQAIKIRNLDITDYIGHAHLWPEYYKQPEIVGAVVPYVYFY